MTTPSGPLAWGQAGQYNAVDDRAVITAMANGRTGLQVAPALTAAAGLVVNVGPSWRAVVACADGTLAVVGSRTSVPVTVPAGPATGVTTSYIWCDVDPDNAVWTLNVIPVAAATGRIGFALGTVVAPANAGTAAAMTLTPAVVSYGNPLGVSSQASWPPFTPGNNVAVASVTFTLDRRTLVNFQANVTGTTTSTSALSDPRMLLTLSPSAAGGWILVTATAVSGPSVGFSGSQIIDLAAGTYTFVLNVLSAAGTFTCTGAKLTATAMR